MAIERLAVAAVRRFESIHERGRRAAVTAPITPAVSGRPGVAVGSQRGAVQARHGLVCRP